MLLFLVLLLLLLLLLFLFIEKLSIRRFDIRFPLTNQSSGNVKK
jgi:hypothetical protein